MYSEWVTKDSITRNLARLEVLGGSRGCSERLHDTAGHSGRVPEGSGGLLEVLGALRELWKEKRRSLFAICNELPKLIKKYRI